MRKLKQVFYVVLSEFRRWHKNPKVILCFSIAFILCFLLSDKVMQFAAAHDTYLQITEAFIWTFGDSQSVLAVTLLLLFLFSDVPNLSGDVPLFMVRIDRKTWLMGQIFYLVSATFLFALFILFSTGILSCQRAFTADMWSRTAAILGYSGIGESIAIPAFVKVLELTLPYECTGHIFGLLIGYSTAMASLMLFLNLCRNNLGMIGGVIFSGFGLVMNRDIVAQWFGISLDQIRYANIICGWISPLNHATYYMHNFGYDDLPRLWMSYVFFAGFSLLFFGLSLLKIRNYSFRFTGTEN